ncbi:hypothetical protein J1N35_002558 [Gossypium stocksii]|uniref:Uncharacterized protein n=1 Tax=Gossypium stocksii TaxID=47602 RepID=A0A9D3WM67_9ROSI|nr:hypothetical protein J1N35_002558 [Gossypium stocksii]
MPTRPLNNGRSRVRIPQRARHSRYLLVGGYTSTYNQGASSMNCTRLSTKGRKTFSKGQYFRLLRNHIGVPKDDNLQT